MPEQLTSQRIQISIKSLLDLAQSAMALKPRRLWIKARNSGGYASNMKGRGMEFDESRVYQPGDDIRNIDWRVSARTGKTHTKVYREERERPVFISVDKRPAMQFATRGVFKFVQAARLAALLAWMAQKQGDRVGGQVYTQASCMELKPQNGRQAVLHFFHALLQASDSDGDALDLAQVTARLSRHVRPGSLVYLISDFRGFDQLCETHIAKMALHCDVVLVHVFDPLEACLPARGRYRFTDGRRDVMVDSGDRQRFLLYQQHFQQHQAALKNLVKKRRLGFIQCRTNQDPVQVLQ